MFLKNKNIIFKIRRSKVTDYAALSQVELHGWIQIIPSGVGAGAGGAVLKPF